MSALGAWLDGEPLQTLPLDLRAAHYGDGVFRTLRRDGGRIALRVAHVERLCADAAALGMALAPGRVATALDQPGLPGDAVLKLCAWRGGAGRGYRPDPVAPPRLALFAYALPGYPAAHWHRGVTVTRLRATLSRNAALGGIKHCNRLDQVLAAAELAEGEAEEGLCRDGEGRFVCGTRSNLFLLCDGRLHTPPITDCGVRGVIRERILQRASTLGLSIAETPVDERLLAGAQGLALTNSLIGVWPVAQLDGTALTQSARLAHTLRPALEPPFLPDNLPPCAL